MNTPLLVAAGFSAFGGLLHSILGERLILSKVATEGLPETLGSSVSHSGCCACSGIS